MRATRCEAVCPECREALVANGDETRCAGGHVYPVREGVPVLLVQSEGWNTSTVARAFEATYRRDEEPWDYSKRGAEQLKYAFLLDQARRLLGGALHGRTVADIGCSLGGATLALAGQGAEVLAMDLSPTAVQRLAQRHAQSQLPGTVAFAVASATCLPVADQSLDLAILSDGLYTWNLNEAQVRACLASTSRALKPAGVALFQEHITPRRFDGFIRMIDGPELRVTEVLYLGDRLYYTVERLAKGLRVRQAMRGALASIGVAKALRAVSRAGGRRGSKHLCVVARPKR